MSGLYRAYRSESCQRHNVWVNGGQQPMVLAPAQLPVGVVTALLGGPFFIYLIVREKTGGRLWGG